MDFAQNVSLFKKMFENTIKNIEGEKHGIKFVKTFIRIKTYKKYICYFYFFSHIINIIYSTFKAQNDANTKPLKTNSCQLAKTYENNSRILLPKIQSRIHHFNSKMVGLYFGTLTIVGWNVGTFVLLFICV